MKDIEGTKIENERELTSFGGVTTVSVKEYLSFFLTFRLHTVYNILPLWLPAFKVKQPSF